MILTNLSGFASPVLPVGAHENNNVANMMAALTRDCDVEMKIDEEKGGGCKEPPLKKHKSPC